MRFHLRTLAVPSLLFAAACSFVSSPDTDDPGDPGDPGVGQPVTPVDQAATRLGVSIMARDARGVPSLIRAIVPRAGLRAAAPEVVARDHVAALLPLWVQGATPMTLVDNGTQRLRNGASIVRLAQQIDGVVVDGGEIRVLLHVNGSLAAVSGTLLPATTKAVFVSSPREALEHALDQQRAAGNGDHRGWRGRGLAGAGSRRPPTAAGVRSARPARDRHDRRRVEDGMGGRGHRRRGPGSAE
jgi:hypothetical protein